MRIFCQNGGTRQQVGLGRRAGTGHWAALESSYLVFFLPGLLPACPWLPEPHFWSHCWTELEGGCEGRRGWTENRIGNHLFFPTWKAHDWLIRDVGWSPEWNFFGPIAQLDLACHCVPDTHAICLAALDAVRVPPAQHFWSRTAGPPICSSNLPPLNTRYLHSAHCSD